jgi:glutaminase
MNVLQMPFTGGRNMAASAIPLFRFLARTHATILQDESGAVADYIPELTKVDHNQFGIALATMDGNVYEVGDTGAPFTIQSISKAFVFALALEMRGADRVAEAIGVEPSGDAFNSIRLRGDNRPFNPMVNSGAIACSGLIHEVEGAEGFERVRGMMSRCAGRDLTVDDAVFQSEQLTGDRNRAIAYLLRNYGIIRTDVADVLDVYFKQCSVLVTARDLAVMAGTLANGGVNPLTSERVFGTQTVARTLSVMTSSGMYDFAGEWIYRVGIPAKSGVGGGIVAALPAGLGLGTFSPRLDSHGNSVRGLKVCEELSSHFELHMLNGTSDVRSCIVADYDFSIVSPRGRQQHEQKVLDENRSAVRVLELTGSLTFGHADLVSRRVDDGAKLQLLILDFARVPRMTHGAAIVLSEMLHGLRAAGVTPVISGIDKNSVNGGILSGHISRQAGIRDFARLDDAIEWAEDQIIYRFGGFLKVEDSMNLADQELLAGIPPGLIEELHRLGTARGFHAGERIIATGAESNSIFFLQSGMVSVKLADGVRLATLVPGTAFGEMALFESRRTADVWADTAVRCIELPLDRFTHFTRNYPQLGERVMRNLAGLLARRLGRANRRIDLLSSH